MATGSGQQLSSISEARRVSELWIAAFIVTVASVMAALGLVRVIDGAPGGVSTLVIGAAYAAYYGWALIRARRSAPSDVESLVRTVGEVSVATLAVVLNGVDDPAFALRDAPVLLYAMAVMASVLRLRPRLSLVAGTLAGVEWIAVYAFVSGGEALAPDLTWIAAFQRMVLLAFVGAVGYRISTATHALAEGVAAVTLEREQVRRAFGLYVAGPVIERVLSGEVVGATERRNLTVLFVDIRDFTAFSSGRPPDVVLDRLNLALDLFAQEVQRRGGIVNKFLGDGLMAIFGAPLDDPGHARQAVQAAVAIAAAADRLARSGRYPELRIGVGVHTGEVVVGDVGGEGHREYTAIGDVVNVASRIEAATKQLGQVVLVSADVAAAMGTGFVAEPFPDVALRGRGPMTLYSVRSPDAASTKPVVSR